MSTNPSEVTNDRKVKIEKLAKELNDLLIQEKELWNNKIKPTLYTNNISFDKRDSDKTNEIHEKIKENLNSLTNSIQGLKQEQLNASNFPTLAKLVQDKSIYIDNTNNVAVPIPYTANDLVKLLERFPPVDTIQLEDNIELNKSILSINKSLERLKSLVDKEEKYINQMNNTTKQNENISENTFIAYQNNDAEISKLAQEIANKLQYHNTDEIEYIRQRTNNFNNLGNFTQNNFVVPTAVTISEKAEMQIQKMRQNQLDQFAQQIKRESPHLEELAKEFRLLTNKLKQQLQNNNNDMNKLDTTILKRVQTLNTYLKKAVDGYNKKFDDLRTSEQDIKYIASKADFDTSWLINNRMPYPRFENEHLERHFNPPQIPPEVATPTVLPNQDGNATVSLTGQLVSNDWVHNKELAKQITNVMEEALTKDPYFKSLNLQYEIKKINLSTPQNPSTGLKGLEVTSKDPNKTISFTATLESVSGNGNTENLKAMSIQIVKNLETRISMGATGLKIDLGDCEPESVKKEFSELINKQLENMLQKNQGKPQFNGYSMDKLKLQVTSTPTVNAVITSTNQTNNTQQTNQRMGSHH